MAKSSIDQLAKLDGPEAVRQQVFKDLGDLDQYDILDEDVLFALYVPSNVLASGVDATGKKFQLIGTDNNTAETRYQGKVGILIKSGPNAFKYHNNGQPYEGTVPQEGDWIIVTASDGREIFLKDTSAKEYVACRRIPWTGIKMRVKDPRTVR